MNEQLTQILQFLLETAKATGEFAKEQLPLVAQEIVTFGIAKHVIGFLAAALVGVAGWRGLSRYVQKVKESKGNIWSEEQVGLGRLLQFGGAAVCICLAVSNLISLSQAILAPRLYLLEYLKDMVGK